MIHSVMVCEKIFTPSQHALMVEDGAFSHKIDYFTIFQEIQNPKGHQNCIIGSKVRAILLKGWILTVGGVAWGRVCAQPAKQALLQFVFGNYFASRLYFLESLIYIEERKKILSFQLKKWLCQGLLYKKRSYLLFN